VLKLERQPALLPHGFQLGDLWIHAAEIRPLNGYDEQVLAENAHLHPLLRIDSLLQRVVSFGQFTEKINLSEIANQLTLGDRAALVLQIRQNIIGDDLQVVLKCPLCDETISADLSAKSLIPPPFKDAATTYPVEFERFQLFVRPLTAAVLEAAVKSLSEFEPKELLVRLCIVSSNQPLPDKLSDGFLTAVATKLEEIDPLADPVLDFTCPNCGKTFQSPLDIEDFFLKESAARLKDLEREIHWLAFNYNWSEEAILSLPVTRRKRYIELINATIAEETV
jgi:hypothetical protein